MSRPPRCAVAIVGGGLAGLATARAFGGHMEGALERAAEPARHLRG